MGKDPSFPFYANDWLSSTKRALMTPAQRGAYVDLLCHQWNDPDCSLPDDDESLAVLSGLLGDWLPNGCRLVGDCFPPHPIFAGRIANTRLLEIKAEREEWREKSREGGKKSAESRRKALEAKGLGVGKGGSTTVPTNTATNGQPNGNSSPSSSFSSPPSFSGGDKLSCPSYRFDETDRALAGRLWPKVLEIQPGQKQPNLDKWASVLRLMRERDGHTLAEIESLFDWANNDEFWKVNIRSPEKLRKQWDELLVRRERENKQAKPDRPKMRRLEAFPDDH